jgi:hypothetical protein
MVMAGVGDDDDAKWACAMGWMLPWREMKEKRKINKVIKI